MYGVLWFFVLVVWRDRVAADTVDLTLQVGESLEFAVLDRQVNFKYHFNKTAEGQSPALRLAVSSENASSLHPLLFTVLQNRGVTSWSLPYVESGFKFSSVERTLCPFLNNHPDLPEGEPLSVVLEVSTSSPTPVHVTINSSFVENFYHRLNTEVSITASPSSPAYLLFEHPPEHQRVRVRFSSMDDTSTVCAIASIQKSFCPVEELLDSPNHRGLFQSMRSQAAINVELVQLNNDTDIITDRQQTQFDFFYIVVSVFPSNSVCESQGMATSLRLITTLEVVDNFNPVQFNGGELIKNINITIETVIPEWGYAVAILIPTIMYFMFYFVAFGWILFADWFRHQMHPLEHLIEERKTKLEDYLASQEDQPLLPVLDSAAPTEVSLDPEAGLTPAATAAARQSSKDADDNNEISVDEVDGESSSPSHLTSPGSKNMTDYNAASGGASGAKKSFLSNWRRSQKDRVVDAHSQTAGSSRKPSMLSVMLGSHYDNAISPVTTPSPHYPQYLHSPTYSMTNSPKNPAATKRHRSASETQREDSVHFNVLKTSMSASAVHNNSTRDHQIARSVSAGATCNHRVIRSISAGSPHNQSVRPFNESSLSLHSPVMDQVSYYCHRQTSIKSGIINKPGENSPDRGMVAHLSYHRAIELGTMERMAEEGEEGEEGEELKDSDNRSIESGCEYLHDMEPFPINMRMCELPEFDETSKVQRQYSRLYWYLMAAIVFYAIPGYQLVITYQQLLTLSGNQDICYFNSLCSHPWRVRDNLTISALNNIFSNIGYFLLGFLFIWIAYRRRRVYSAVEKVVNNPFITNRKERVGIPQHFGIYYAIGLSMMAEGFMSIAYHICPGKTNYQFDTTFMFVLAGLGIFKLLESRNPDLHPGLHKLLVLFAAIIFMVVVGVLYASQPWFYAVFFIVHTTSTLFVTIETYYRWQIHPTIKCLKALFKHISSRPYFHFKHKPKFVQAVFANIVNWGFGIYAMAFQPPDFGTFFLAVMLTNFILLLLYYIITKRVYGETPSLRPIVFIVLSLTFWACGIYFYSQAVTNWLDSPAISRDGNRDCIVLFYDSHDMWHFTSAFALFFSFLMLMALDDDTEGTQRTGLRVF